MGGPIVMERRGCDSIGNYTHFVTLKFDLIHELDLRFQRSNLAKALYQECEDDWQCTEEMWVDRMLDPLCELELGSWTCISKDKSWWKQMYAWSGVTDWHRAKWGYDPSIGGRTHFVTLNVDLIHELDLWFQTSNFEKALYQEWGDNWQGTKEMWVDRMLDPLCELELGSWTCIFKVKIWRK